MRLVVVARVRAWLAPAFAVALAGCVSTAHYPINPPLERYDPQYGYRIENVATDRENAREVMLILLFSGGGTRASALAYGALEALRDARISIDGNERTLLSEIDYISSVSGGSIVAAYYGLYRDRLFTDFGPKFLYRDVQGELVRSMFGNLYAITSPRYGRSELFAEYLDRELFAGATFRDLHRQPRPFIAISATDMSLGGQFVFAQSQFDLICSDLEQFSVARAVAASAAIPPVLSPVTLWNYAGRCGYEMPPLPEGAPEYHARRDRDRNEMASYLDVKTRPYVHLLDGGLVDNLALRQPMAVVLRQGGIMATLDALGYRDVRYAVFVSVDAEREPTFDLDKSADIPGPIKVLNAMKNVLALNSFEASVHIEEDLKEWQDELDSARRPGTTPPEFFLIDISLRSIVDNEERDRYMHVPTTLRLPAEDVDALRALARKLMQESPDFQRLMQKIGAPAREPPAQPLRTSPSPAQAR